jgi:WD40 repeat protein
MERPPLPALSEAIEHSVRDVLGERVPAGIQTPDALVGTIKLWSDVARSELLIILDQFEEYFLYHGQDKSDGSFYAEFPLAVNDPNLRTSFLISLREDALSKLDLFKTRIPGLFANYMRVRHLDTAGAVEAIKKPLEVFSNLTETYLPFTVEDELVEDVCLQLEAASVYVREPRYIEPSSTPSANGVETSYLQLVMTRLWEEELLRGSHRLRLNTLYKLGGAANIVETHLDVNLTGFPNDEQEVTAAAFRYLVTPSGTKVAYTASDLAQLTGLPEERVEAVLEQLCTNDIRILRSYDTQQVGRNVKNYEIYHDVLAPAILDWRARYLRDKEMARAAQEAKERQERERVHLQEEALKQLRQEEERRRREQARARRRTRQLLTILMLSAVATTLMVVLYFYGEDQRRKAEAAAGEAEKQRAEAHKILSVVNSIDSTVPFFKAVMRGHTKPVLSVAFSPDGTRIVTAGADGITRVCEADTGRIVAELSGHTLAVRSALYSPDGALIATSSDDRTARLWDASTGRPLRLLEGHEKEVSAARFSPDGKFIVTASADGTARVWDAATGRQTALFSDHSGEAAYAVTYAAFSPDGQRVVTGASDGKVRVWGVESGSFTLLGSHANEVNTAVFSPDGRSVVTASSDGEARIWDAATGQSYALKGHIGPVNSAAFSPDGLLVVTASDDRTARIWDVKLGRSHKVLEGHTGAVLGAAFSNDSLVVITASDDRTARVWEVGSGRVLFELRGHTDAVNQAVFSPRGNLAATAGQDMTARTWAVGGEGGIRITDAAIKVEPDDYRGPCPVGVTISASITASGSGTIRYRFVRSDGYIGADKPLDFDRSGTKDVSTTWLFGARASQSLSGNVQLEITSGQSFHRKEAAYDIRCALRPSPTP